MFLILELRVNLILDPGTYIFRVSAFTSGGYGGYATLKFPMEIGSKCEDI